MKDVCILESRDFVPSECEATINTSMVYRVVPLYVNIVSHTRGISTVH